MQPFSTATEATAAIDCAKTVEREVKPPVDEHQRHLLRLLTALHRENTLLREQLRTDPLTGLFNRRALFDELEREWEHWVRHGRSASLLLIDVNDFKAINDTHGHPTGDDVLIGIARQLEQQVRASDRLARLGGDEFAILLRDSDGNDAQQVAAKLRDTPFICTAGGANTPVILRFAVGVATLDSTTNTVRPTINSVSSTINSVREWLEAADRQMYRHKRSVHLSLHRSELA